jgi:hypothetical protein
MINHIQPLVVTPSPMPTESMMGLILRTSEMNFYESPFLILRHAGMTENEIRSAKPPIDKLAKLYAREPNDFCYMGQASSDKRKHNKQWRILNQIVPALYVNIKAAKICPECILEDGYIDGFWDLRHAVACPTHSKMAITSCPSCCKPLNWHRQGLLTCRCGQDLSELRGVSVEDPLVLGLLELVKRKLHGDPLDVQHLCKFGFPVHEIDNISIATLLGIIGRLQPGNKRKTSFNVPDGISVERHAIKLASGMLAQWPNGFYDYLEATHQSNSLVRGSTLHKQFHRFCCSFFKSGLPTNEISFLENAFMSFGNDRWKTRGFIDPRFSNKLNAPNSIVGMKGLAEHLGIMVPTAENYVERGIIVGKTVATANSTRLIFDLSSLPFSKAEGNHHRLRGAAKFIGLPENLLSILRKLGIYKIKRLAWGLDGYSELDLVEFKETLLNNAPLLANFNAPEFISLKKIIQMKLGDQSKAGKVIAAVLDGDVVPVGRMGDAVKDITFNRADIDLVFGI